MPRLKGQKKTGNGRTREQMSAAMRASWARRRKDKAATEGPRPGLVSLSAAAVTPATIEAIRWSAVEAERDAIRERLGDIEQMLILGRKLGFCP